MTTDIQWAIEASRRAGQTTRLIEVLKVTPSAVLVVQDADYRDTIVRNFKLDRRRVVHLGELRMMRACARTLFLWDNSAIARNEMMLGRDSARYKRIVRLARRYLQGLWNGHHFMLVTSPIHRVMVILMRKWEIMPKMEWDVRYGERRGIK